MEPDPSVSPSLPLPSALVNVVFAPLWGSIWSNVKTNQQRGGVTSGRPPSLPAFPLRSCVILLQGTSQCSALFAHVARQHTGRRDLNAPRVPLESTCFSALAASVCT